jgi:hypothetical protein
LTSRAAGTDIMHRITWAAAVVAACAASASPKSEGFTDADVDHMAAEMLKLKTTPGMADALNDLSSELMECSAITMASAICLRNTPGQELTAQQTEDISNWTGKLGFILGSGVGVSERALTARLKLAADDIKRGVSSSCRNMSILLVRFRESCETLVSNPVVRLKAIFLGKR